MDMTHKKLKELLLYSEETGEFTWAEKSVRKTMIGNIAGTVQLKGHIQIQLFGVKYLAHRLAWLYVTGSWPNGSIDHINRVPSDNRFCNLREVNHSQNAQNSSFVPENKSGFLGVRWAKHANKWRAKIKLGGREIHLGYFSTPDDAGAAYLEAKKELHPFSNL